MTTDPDTQTVSVTVASFHAVAVELTAAYTRGDLNQAEMQNARADARAVVKCLPAHPQDARRDAAAEQVQERADESCKVAEIVLGTGSHLGRERVGDVVKLGDDYLVQVMRNRSNTTWTTVVGGERSSWHYHTQEAAILHLIARRHDDNPNSNASAAFYAGRVLGLPKDE